jgi:hypothetical protein
VSSLLNKPKKKPLIAVLRSVQVEFDKPSKLLKKENGRFRSLVDESGDRDLLYAMVNKAETTTGTTSE